MAADRPEPRPMRVALLAVTDGGQRLAAKIAQGLPGSEVIAARTGLGELLAGIWPRYDGFVFVMAAGIVVRLIAPLLQDKRTDPCVVVVDEKGRFAISLLAGHLGGGNALAGRVAVITDGQEVITTASDTLGLTALDLWAREQGLAAEGQAPLTRASAQLVNAGSLRVYLDGWSLPLPTDFIGVADPAGADCIVSNRLGDWPAAALLLRPRNLVVGIGCNRGTGREQIEAALGEALREHGLSELAVRNLASIDLKADEAGLIAFAEARGLRIDFYNKDQLNGVAGVSRSDTVLRATGAQGVAEPAALLSAGGNKLLVRKMKWKDVTIAVAEAPCTWSAPAPAA
ncbi:MAG: cobalamin biosynthesis protein [Desulfobulbaceae bacterium]|nr:cobalamin biosynthesis protein [Desulfobulbaceae bacterium]